MQKMYVQEDGTVKNHAEKAVKQTSCLIRQAAVLLMCLLCAAGAWGAAADQAQAQDQPQAQPQDQPQDQPQNMPPSAAESELDRRMLDSVGGSSPEDSVFGVIYDWREDQILSELYQLVRSFFAAVHAGDDRTEWKKYVDPAVLPFFAQIHDQMMTDLPKPEKIRLGEFRPGKTAAGEKRTGGEIHVRIVTAAGREAAYRIIVTAAGPSDDAEMKWRIRDIMRLEPDE